jgi:hypothetical protein
MKTALTLVALLALPAAASERAGTFVVVYQAAPANRAAFLRELESSGARQLERWKAEGALQGYRLLVSRHLDSRAWDAMAILTVSDAARWKKLEQKFPGAVPSSVLALASSVETVPATVARQAQRRSEKGESVFLVIPYEVTASTAEYVAYLDDYVLPQLDGWAEEGILGGHAVYLAQYPAGRQWQSLLVLEYRGDEALASREEVVKKVRARLAANAKWKAVSDNKKKVRVERAPVVADPVSSKEIP